uniref:AT23593p n=1 Tax=Drosophila melanogaster TaxID=7227 RepID=Q8T402_DROME|nr:AT23593p [Drosophila melanogaster]
MSNLKQKDIKPDVAVSKSVKTSRKAIEYVKSDASDIDEDINRTEYEYASSSGFVNFLRDFKKRYGEYYSNYQIRRAAETRWNEMSFRHRCQYSAEPLDTFHVEPNRVSSLQRSIEAELRIHSEISGCDTFFGACGSNSCTPRKENKCSKPRVWKSRNCARPRKACPRPRNSMECGKPKAKPRCLKPKSSKPKCSV